MGKVEYNRESCENIALILNDVQKKLSGIRYAVKKLTALGSNGPKLYSSKCINTLYSAEKKLSASQKCIDSAMEIYSDVEARVDNVNMFGYIDKKMVDTLTSHQRVIRIDGSSYRIYPIVDYDPQRYEAMKKSGLFNESTLNAVPQTIDTKIVTFTSFSFAEILTGWDLDGVDPGKVQVYDSKKDKYVTQEYLDPNKATAVISAQLVMAGLRRLNAAIDKMTFKVEIKKKNDETYAEIYMGCLEDTQYPSSISLAFNKLIESHGDDDATDAAARNLYKRQTGKDLDPNKQYTILFKLDEERKTNIYQRRIWVTDDGKVICSDIRFAGDQFYVVEKGKSMEHFSCNVNDAVFGYSYELDCSGDVLKELEVNINETS